MSIAGGLGRLASIGRKSKPKSAVPGAEEFTPRAVNRAVLAETVQHPMTILPAAASAVGFLYIGLIGLGPGALAVTFFSALAALGAWVFNYFIRGEDFAVRHVASLRERRAQQRRDEAASLEAEWTEVGLEEGVKQARELREAYSKLEEFLKSRFAESGGSTPALNVQRLMVLAEDTYREGVAILRRALDSSRALKLLDWEKLRRELEEWQAQLAELSADGDEAREVRRAGLETRIAAHERRLKLGKDQATSVEQLLAESEVLESALETTYLEAVDLGSPDTFFARGQSAAELERAVSAARRVEDRLRGMSEEREEDEIYLQAGRVDDMEQPRLERDEFTRETQS